MSNGIVVNGEDNSLLFSTETDNLFYQGKAVYSTNYTQSAVDYEAFSGLWGVLYNLPRTVFYEYLIDLPAAITTILPFVHNPIGKRISVVSSVKTSSTQWKILIVATTNPNNSYPGNSPTAYIPTVYVFASYIDAAWNTGFGINVFDQNGAIKFTSNEQPLLIKAIYSGANPYSNLVQIRESGGNLYYVGNSGNRYVKSINWFNPLGTVQPISKPAIFYSCSQTCVGVATDRWIHESTAVFNPSTSQLGIEWALAGTSLFSSLPNSQSSGGQFVAFIVDGAQYD